MDIYTYIKKQSVKKSLETNTSTFFYNIQFMFNFLVRGIYVLKRISRSQENVVKYF